MLYQATTLRWSAVQDERCRDLALYNARLAPLYRPQLSYTASDYSCPFSRARAAILHPEPILTDLVSHILAPSAPLLGDVRCRTSSHSHVVVYNLHCTSVLPTVQCFSLFRIVVQSWNIYICFADAEGVLICACTVMGWTADICLHSDVEAANTAKRVLRIFPCQTVRTHRCCGIVAEMYFEMTLGCRL